MRRPEGAGNKQRTAALLVHVLKTVLVHIVMTALLLHVLKTALLRVVLKQGKTALLYIAKTALLHIVLKQRTTALLLRVVKSFMLCFSKERQHCHCVLFRQHCCMFMLKQGKTVLLLHVVLSEWCRAFGMICGLGAHTIEWTTLGPLLWTEKRCWCCPAWKEGRKE